MVAAAEVVAAPSRRPCPLPEPTITDVLIVDSDLKLVDPFLQMLLCEPALRLSGAVATGGGALALLAAQAPDVMLIDLELPDIDAVEVIREAIRQHPACRCLAFVRLDDGPRIKASVEAGACGFLLEDATCEQIVDAIHDVRTGGCSLCPRIARQVITSLRSASLSPPDAARAMDDTVVEDSPLTLRESEVLRLAAKGLGFDTIGDLLEISTHTVVAHAKKIYRKLSVHSRSEAVYEASQMGWL